MADDDKEQDEEKEEPVESRDADISWALFNDADVRCC